MVYKEITNKYLKAEEKYNETLENGKKASFNNLDTSFDEGFEYSVCVTAIADFVCALKDNFSDEKRNKYIKDMLEKITYEKNNIISKGAKKYYDSYIRMLELFNEVTKLDFIRLVNYINRNMRKEDRKLNRKSNSKKVQLDGISKIESKLSMAYVGKELGIVHIGEEYEKRLQELQNRNKLIYSLIITAIKDGLDNQTSITDNDINYEDYDESVLSEQEIDEYYIDIYNTVTSFSKKYKNKLSSKMKDIL